MKQKYLIALSIIIVFMFVMVAFSDNVDHNNSNIINNNAATTKYVKIGNITYMNNFNISQSGNIQYGDISSKSINSVKAYENSDIKNNTPKASGYSYTGTNNTNYLLQCYNNSDIKYTIAFTDTFKDYKVEIGNIIYSNNSENISYIYANVVPINSSKILLGNEFTLDYKSTYNNEMKNLINNIKLISINYMFSTNNTMHRFGIEYSYIATAMSTMLKSTDNNVKNIEINQTVGIAIDWRWVCDLSVVLEIGSAISLIGATGGLAWPVFFVVIAALGVIGGWIGMGYTCDWPTGDPWFPSWL